jgi:hypothetical protein
VTLSRREHAKTAAEFHLVGVVNWLLKDARRRAHELVRGFALEHRLMDVLLGMNDLPEDDSRLFCGSMAAAYEDELLMWLPGMTAATLLARGEGRDEANVTAFIDAAAGHPRTLTFIETENRKSICGAFLGPAWSAFVGICDPERTSFVFTLKNHLDVAPTICPKRGDGCAAVAFRGMYVYFGDYACVISPAEFGATLGMNYEDAVRRGPAIFHGDDPTGRFHCGRWELWETR